MILIHSKYYLAPEEKALEKDKKSRDRETLTLITKAILSCSKKAARN